MLSKYLEEITLSCTAKMGFLRLLMKADIAII